MSAAGQERQRDRAGATSAPSYLGQVDAIIRPVGAGNAFERTVERILQLIQLGVVVSGERLPPERDLATRLGVSRVTIRQAIGALRDAGYVESRRGRYGGTFVRYEPTLVKPRRGRIPSSLTSDLDDVLIMRMVLETGASAAAAERVPDQADAAYLRGRLRDCDRADLAHYRQADSRLHLAIAETAGSPSLLTAVADIRARINRLLDRIPLLPPNIAHSNAQHREVVEAIVGGDADAARVAMADHLDGTAALLHGFLSSGEEP